MGKYLSGSVLKNLTLYRIKNIVCQKYHKRAFIQSFPMMYITGGQHLVVVCQNEDFLKKTASKTAFWSDTNLDQVTLEGAGTHNFKIRGVVQGKYLQLYLQIL